MQLEHATSAIIAGRTDILTILINTLHSLLIGRYCGDKEAGRLLFAVRKFSPANKEITSSVLRLQGRAFVVPLISNVGSKFANSNKPGKLDMR